ncbi:unnamed protein product [Prorocentrum cordatum]|uniref:Uncharacterized protein n=1 Tax=Prorocentrum cordatum TaxID=2364126 RepID=A0ABN9R7M3_9DINO|nr:unnamed protein product [Polarella glacialis]
MICKKCFDDLVRARLKCFCAEPVSFAPGAAWVPIQTQQELDELRPRSRPSAPQSGRAAAGASEPTQPKTRLLPPHEPRTLLDETAAPPPPRARPAPRPPARSAEARGPAGARRKGRGLGAPPHQGGRAAGLAQGHSLRVADLRADTGRTHTETNMTLKDGRPAGQRPTCGEVGEGVSTECRQAAYLIFFLLSALELASGGRFCVALSAVASRAPRSIRDVERKQLAGGAVAADASPRAERVWVDIAKLCRASERDDLLDVVVGEISTFFIDPGVREGFCALDPVFSDAGCQDTWFLLQVFNEGQWSCVSDGLMGSLLIWGFLKGCEKMLCSNLCPMLTGIVAGGSLLLSNSCTFVFVLATVLVA